MVRSGATLLVLTNSKDQTADYLISVLDRSRVPLVRFDTDTLILRSEFAYQRRSPGSPSTGGGMSPLILRTFGIGGPST